MSTPNPFAAVQVNLVSEVSFQKLIVVSSPPHVGPVGVVDHEVCPLYRVPPTGAHLGALSVPPDD